MTRPSACWCGHTELLQFSPHYLRCPACETLVTADMPDQSFTEVKDDEHDFYGREYWFSHQKDDLGFSDITERARNDLPERVLHWLRALLKYKLPPGQVLELGGAHGGFVALLQRAGFDATELELSPWVVEYARQTFDIPVLLGPIEEQQIEPNTLDTIALMDVLEHLPDPLKTMGHCLSLLKADGILLIQTPCYVEGTSYEWMVEQKNPFLEQLKHKQHLYLFSQTSIRELFRRLGAEHLAFEPAMFAHYDQFFAVSREPLANHAPEEIARALSSTPNSRMVLALLDLDGSKRQIGDRLSDAEADRAERLKIIQRLSRELAAAEADRAARLNVIRSQSKEIGRIPGLEAQIAASQATVQQLQEKLSRREQEITMLENKRIIKLLRRAKLLKDAPAAQPKDLFEVNYEAIREPKKPVGIGYNPTVIENIISGLQGHGYTVEDYAIDIAGYRDYYTQAAYDQKYPNYYRPVIWEKSLEHYIAAQLLALQPDDVYIDIASEGSPVPEIYSRLYGSNSYRQDMIYPAGLNDHMIGGDAGDMPVPDGFASKMALHCSFEHFEGDADMRFFREIGRVLRPGGAVCIVPFYLFDQYAILTDPEVSVPQGVPFESDAVVYCRRGWNNRHGRFYNPDNVIKRLSNNLNGLTMKIYKITNAKEADPRCYAEFAALITKPAGTA